MTINRIARGKLGNDNLEKELESIIRNIEEIFNDNKATNTIEVYVAETSGGSATKKLTIKINQFNVITALTLT